MPQFQHGQISTNVGPTLNRWTHLKRYDVYGTYFGNDFRIEVETQTRPGEAGISRYSPHEERAINSLKTDALTKEQILHILAALMQNEAVYRVQSDAWRFREQVNPSVVKTGITPETVDKGNPGLAELILKDFQDR